MDSNSMTNSVEQKARFYHETAFNARWQPPFKSNAGLTATEFGNRQEAIGFRPMNEELSHSYNALAAWCKARDYAGYDPFDGLNSRLFQATPFKHWRASRLAWVQFLKRCPVNLRPLLLITPGRNAKGLALFALARLAEFRRARQPAAEQEARYLLDKLAAMRLEGYAGACWGYNFSWQGRAFYAPQGTPTIVPTAFAARAFIEAADVLDETYMKPARSVCDFILGNLRETETGEDEVCWSYSPLDRTRVLNASLLAAETLGVVGALRGETELQDWARRGVNYVIRRQWADGSWPYGGDSYQGWTDNFHTAFILTSLARIREHCGDPDGKIAESIRRGYDFWNAHFFSPDGWPKYFHDKIYPADLHSTGAAIVALLELTEFDPDAPRHAQHLANWADANMRSADGAFHYQKHANYTNKIPYMRWTQAWMMYALARLNQVAG